MGPSSTGQLLRCGQLHWCASCKQARFFFCHGEPASARRTRVQGQEVRGARDHQLSIRQRGRVSAQGHLGMLSSECDAWCGWEGASPSLQADPSEHRCSSLLLPWEHGEGHARPGWGQAAACSPSISLWGLHAPCLHVHFWHRIRCWDLMLRCSLAGQQPAGPGRAAAGTAAVPPGFQAGGPVRCCRAVSGLFGGWRTAPGVAMLCSSAHCAGAARGHCASQARQVPQGRQTRCRPTHAELQLLWQGCWVPRHGLHPARFFLVTGHH